MAKLTKRGRHKSQMLESHKCGVSYFSLTQRKKACMSKREALPPPNGQDKNNDKVVQEQGGKCEDITSVACQGNEGDKDGGNVGERASLNCMDHNNNDTSDGRGNKGDLKSATATTQVMARTRTMTRLYESRGVSVKILQVFPVKATRGTRTGTTSESVPL